MTTYMLFDSNNEFDSKGMIQLDVCMIFIFSQFKYDMKMIFSFFLWFFFMIFDENSDASDVDMHK